MNDDEILIELNVGGTTYSSSKTTLTRYEDTLLFLMARDEYPTTRDKNGRIFIDRDGALFRHILNYIRYGKLILNELELNDLDKLKIEADFYRIEPLIQEIDDLLVQQHEKTLKKIRLDEERFVYYQNSNKNEELSKVDHDETTNAVGGYHLDLIEHHFLNTNTKRLQIITHYDIFKMLPLSDNDMRLVENLRSLVQATNQSSPFKSNEGACWYLGNELFEIQNISYITRSQIGHILLQFTNCTLLHSNIAYLNSNTNAYNLSILDKWQIPKYVVEKYTSVIWTNFQKALPPSATVGYIDWNPQ